MMIRMAEMLVRRRRGIAALLLVVTLLAAWRASQLEIDLAFRHFFPTDQFQAEPEGRGDGGAAYLVAVLESNEPYAVFRHEAREAITDITRAVEQIPHVTRVISLPNVLYLGDGGDDAVIGPLGAILEAAADPIAIGRRVCDDPLYARRVVSPDGTVTPILALLEPNHQGIATRRPTIASFERAVRKALPQGFRVEFAGYPVAEARTAGLLGIGFLKAQIVAVILMAAALTICFRTLLGVLLPLVIVGFGIVLTLGFMEVAGQRLTLTNLGVPVMVLVIGVAEVSFFLARYYEEMPRQATGARDLAVRVTAAVTPPATVAAATTAMAFLSLMSSHLPLTRDFGLTMAAGIAATFLSTIALLPGVSRARIAVNAEIESRLVRTHVRR
jgi:predicted RND superfamily exporter protein